MCEVWSSISIRSYFSCLELAVNLRYSIYVVENKNERKTKANKKEKAKDMQSKNFSNNYKNMQKDRENKIYKIKMKKQVDKTKKVSYIICI